jgi:hypothetical protein
MTDTDISKALEKEKDFDEKVQKIKEDELKERENTIQEESKYEGSDTKNTLILLGVLIGVFLITIGGFMLYNKYMGEPVLTLEDLHQKNLEGGLDEDEGYIYNGFSVVLMDKLWWSEIKVMNETIAVPLHFGPKDVEEVKISGTLDKENFNKGQKIYIAINPEVESPHYTLATSELAHNIAQGVMRVPEAACTKEDLACENRTIISCENNSGNLPVIELAGSLDNETKIEYSGSCIKLSGNEYEIVKATDRILYKWYKVMD